MALIELQNISCQYRNGKFELYWELPPGKTVKKIIIAEAPPSGPITLKLNDVYYQSPHAKQIQIEPTKEIAGKQRRFIVVGSTQDNKISTTEIQNECRKMKERNICCTGLRAVGTLNWEMVHTGNDEVTLHIRSSQEIPSGFLEYSYRYCGVKFRFPVYGTIPKYNKEVSSTIRVVNFVMPNLADGVQMHSPGTAIEIKQEKKKAEGILDKLVRLLRKGRES
ncbi:MAG: hypothetical protein IJY06_09515 [Oscillospiraceae bacterium]|nr:hypothetical protein [Oscillospiraceae bacterium]